MVNNYSEKRIEKISKRLYEVYKESDAPSFYGWEENTMSILNCMGNYNCTLDAIQEGLDNLYYEDEAKYLEEHENEDAVCY